MIGLLHHVPGEKTIMPIARFGNLALIPAEPIPWKGKFIEAYLLESRSIGGLSGSPVFAKMPTKKSESSFCLLGVLRGHWDERDVNVGIAAVTPAIKVAEILSKPELVRERQQADQHSTKYANQSERSAQAKEDSVKSERFGSSELKRRFEASLKGAFASDAKAPKENKKSSDSFADDDDSHTSSANAKIAKPRGGKRGPSGHR